MDGFRGLEDELEPAWTDSGVWKMNWNQRGRSGFISAVEEGIRVGVLYGTALCSCLICLFFTFLMTVNLLIFN